MPAFRSAYVFAPVFEATTPAALTDTFRGITDDNRTNAAFLKKLHTKVSKVANDAQPGDDLMTAFANECEEKDLKLAFDFFDTDGDGFLCREEMLTACRALGEGDTELVAHVKKLDFATFRRLMK